MTTVKNKHWRYTSRLESTELIKRIFKKAHGREINTTRAKQIVAAYLQGKEYYLNASQADISVKPLLLFYGVASLSRSLALFLKTNGGEETLIQGHGLSCYGWSGVLTTDVADSLKNIGHLPVRSCNGLFQDLLTSTNNKFCLHINSSGVDWAPEFLMPIFPIDLTFVDILKRLPDVKAEYTLWTEKSSLVACVSHIQGVKQEVIIQLQKQENIQEIIDYADGRIKISEESNLLVLQVNKDDLPLFINSFIEKNFGSIPDLYVTKPFPNNTYIAQIPLTYILAYYLGMLCRYFPSHWMALSKGNIGDEFWPLMQICITYIEEAFPQLIAEFIEQKLS